MAFVFWQFMITLPLFYRDIHGLSELQIGLLMSLNGGLIFLTEMPIIHKLEQSSINKMQVIAFSLFLLGASYVVLTLTNWVGVLVIGMIFITIGEMLAFPFTNRFAMTRAIKGKEGMYMAMYTMAFAFATIFSAKIGMEVIDRFSFDTNWYLMGVLSLIAVILTLKLKRLLKAAN